MVREAWKDPPREYYDNTDKTCRWDQNPLPKGRTRFCSNECQEQFWIRHDFKRLRLFVFKRDDYRCADCGYQNARSNSRLNADHIIEITDGGEEFDPENIQTLCVDCHKKKTRLSHAKRAAARKEIREILRAVDQMAELCAWASGSPIQLTYTPKPYKAPFQERVRQYPMLDLPEFSQYRKVD